MIKELFQIRLSAFYNSLSFQKQDLWENSDVVVIHSQQEKSPNSQSSQFYLWLIGEELLDITTIFTPSGIYFFCTQKIYPKIRSLSCSATLMRRIPVYIQLKGKNDDGFDLIDSMIRNVRVIRNNKFVDDDDQSCPFVVGYIEGEYPKSKLFWSCINDLEPKKYKAVIVNSGLNKLINTADRPMFGVGRSDKYIRRPPIDDGKNKGVLKHESNFWIGHDEQMFVQFLAKRNESASLEKEKSNLESKFGCIGLNESGRSNLESKFNKNKLPWGDSKFNKNKLPWGISRVNENPLPSTSTNENVSVLMGNLDLSSSSSSGKQDKLRVENIYSDQLFKFGGNWLDGGEEENSKAGNTNGDQVFRFGTSSSDGKADKSKEISQNGDQVFKFGESKFDGNKNGDQLFKFEEGKKDGEQNFKVGGKRGRIVQQPQAVKGGKDVMQLTRRLTVFYASWRKYKEEQWGKADVLVISNTKSVGLLENLSRPISSSFMVWLLDDELPEITAVFTNTGVEFLCTTESFSRLRTIGMCMTMAVQVTVSVQLKKRGEQCVDWLKKTLCHVNIATTSGANRFPLVVGCIIGESMEMEALSPSKMFEVAYVQNPLTNLFAPQQTTLPKQFQMLSLEMCGGANTPEEENSLLEKEGDASSSWLTDGRVDNGGSVEQSKPEENKVFEEDNSSKKLADKMVLLEIKEGDMETSITEEGEKEKQLVEEQNVLGGEQARPTVEGTMYYSVQPTGIIDAASENSLPDDNNGSMRKDSVGSDREDDDWTLIEMECKGEEIEVAEKFSWKRWLMDKTGKSLGLKDEASDEAPSKRTKGSP